MTNLVDVMARFSEPFPLEDVEWKPGVMSKDGTKAIAMPYGNYRSYIDRLNDLVPGEWEVRYQPWGESKVLCVLTVCGVTRSDVGEYEENAKGAVAEGPVAVAQAFKRACVLFGMGGDFYRIPRLWVPVENKRITDEGVRLCETHYQKFLKRQAAQPDAAPAKATAPTAPVKATPTPAPSAEPAATPAATPDPNAGVPWKNKLEMLAWAKQQGVSEQDANALFPVAIKAAGGYSPNNPESAAKMCAAWRKAVTERAA